MDYDYFVIGGGSGGVRAARLAGARGLKVGLAEYDQLGGTCVIRGCVPKKLMVYSASYAGLFEEAVGFGWSVGDVTLDWPTLRDRMACEINRLSGIYERNLRLANVEIIPQHASLAGPNRIKLADGTEISAEKILIATGGRPFVPEGLQGSDLALISDNLFHLEQLPRRLVVVGAGYVAVEFAGVFARLGVEVTLLVRRNAVLRSFDRGLQDYAAAALSHCGVDVRFKSEPSSFARAPEGNMLVTLADGGELECDEVLLAAGRRPHVQNLGLEQANVALSKAGAIVVDEYSRTNVPGIYAIGDVTDRVNLTPVAISEAVALDRTLFDDAPTPVDHEIIPTAIFTQPAVGTVGWSEEYLCAQKLDFDVWEGSFRPLKHTLSGVDEKFFFKLIAEPNEGRVLGLHIGGEEAGELIQCLGIAVKAGLTKRDFDLTMAVHPSAAEELVTLKQPSRKIRGGVPA